MSSSCPHTTHPLTPTLIDGVFGSGKTSRLIEHATDLLNTHPSASVLILCGNHSRQSQFRERLLAGLDTPLSQVPIYTYAGLVRTTLFDFWPLVEAQIKSAIPDGMPAIRPELSGMEESELMLRWNLAQLRQKHPAAFEVFPGGERSLLKQLIRRIRLRSENRLTRREMQVRSEWLAELCQFETAAMEKQFDHMSYALRTLDTNKQLDVFHSLIEKNELVQHFFKDRLRHLVVDDVDESTPAQQDFIYWLSPVLETLTLAGNPQGGTRRGYLNAYPEGWQQFKQTYPDAIETCQRDDVIKHASDVLLRNWQKSETTPLADFEELPPCITLDNLALTRVEMKERVIDDIVERLSNGAPAGDIAVVLPAVDMLTSIQLSSALHRRGIAVEMLSGTRRPVDDAMGRVFLLLLQLVNAKQWQTELSFWDWKTLLVAVLGMGAWSREKQDAFAHWVMQNTVYDEASNHPVLPDLELLNVSEENTLSDVVVTSHTVSALSADDVASIQGRYATLQSWLVSVESAPFEDVLYSAFENLLVTLADEHTRMDAIQRLFNSYTSQIHLMHQMSAIAKQNQEAEDQAPPSISELAMQTQLTDVLSSGTFTTIEANFEKLWFQQVKTGGVADTPVAPRELNPDAIVVGTPQKLIDLEVRRPYFVWMDISSREWARTDNAPLYDAWVHRRGWDDKLDENLSTQEKIDRIAAADFQESLIRQRAAHITKNLMLCASQEIKGFDSELDDMGFSRTSLLSTRFVVAQTDQKNNEPPIVLRSDQAPILNYDAGTMAVSAVPGAGKTFVNVALILHLIEKGIAPESILVLTYMDSAAKTLLSRLKKRLLGKTRALPVVSTIHSLAFRILTDGDHALRLGYDPETVGVMDDYESGEMLSAIAVRTQPESMRSTNTWVQVVKKGITHAKTHGLTPEKLEALARQGTVNYRVVELIGAYSQYQRQLHTMGKLDFTDLIVLAVQLLERYPDIRHRYQHQFNVIIEDEAQDSSRLLQRFIYLLGHASEDTETSNSKKMNLIRTGDTNQSITTTFSSADTSVFRNFLKDADQLVQMDRSSRCAPEVIWLANRWIEKVGAHPELANTFQPVAMQPVYSDNQTLQNPSLLVRPESLSFDMAAQEEAWIAEKIHQLKEQYPDVSIAILVRRNSDVSQITSVLHRSGIQAVSITDKLHSSPVFSVMLAVLRLLVTPSDVSQQAHLYEALRASNQALFDERVLALLKSTPLLYTQPDALKDYPDWVLQLYYDLMELNRLALSGSFHQLLIQMAERLFAGVEERSNAYLCALMADEMIGRQQLSSRVTEGNNLNGVGNNQGDNLGDPMMSPLEYVIEGFEAYHQSWGGRKGFGEMLERYAGHFVQVMSLHKSKGQEFDVVFMPFMQTDLLPDSATQIKMKDDDKLQLELDRILGKTELSLDQLKREKIEEEARLVYVGVTRAKRALYLSSHLSEVTRYHKERFVTPSFAFETLTSLVEQLPTLPLVEEAPIG